jgi:GNAT superfamily N-acetyltransferase
MAFGDGGPKQYFSEVEAAGKPLLLVMAFDGDKAAAGLAARRQSDSAVRIYPPELAPLLSPACIASFGVAPVQNMEREALSARPDVERLETKPADDVPEVERWLPVLETAGFREVACGHTHRLAHSCRLAADPHFGVIKQQAGGAIVPDLWDLARMNGRPSVLQRAHRIWAGGDRAISGWVLDVGAVRAERGRGFGAGLLIDVISALARAGNTKVTAAIDDVNGTSLTLHAKLGFKPSDGRYLTYEKRLRPSRDATTATLVNCFPFRSLK